MLNNFQNWSTTHNFTIHLKGIILYVFPFDGINFQYVYINISLGQYKILHHYYLYRINTTFKKIKLTPFINTKSIGLNGNRGFDYAVMSNNCINFISSYN